MPHIGSTLRPQPRLQSDSYRRPPANNRDHEAVQGRWALRRRSDTRMVPYAIKESVRNAGARALDKSLQYPDLLDNLQSNGDTHPSPVSVRQLPQKRQPG